MDSLHRNEQLTTAAAEDFDERRALALVALPLSCIDRPQKRRRSRGAFYGCYDWHSAVHSTWTMVLVLRMFPQLPIAGLIREKLNDHLTRQAIEGELDFFLAASDFELPYGRSWLLKLFADLNSWDDTDASQWKQNLAPLAEQFAATLLDYVATLEVANKTGVHGNSAYSLSLLLDYANALNDLTFRQAVEEGAQRLFASDEAGPIADEPLGADFLSPCLEEARLMSRVLEQSQFVSWLDSFMPALNLDPFDTSSMNEPELLAAKSHLIGLSFSRAEAMLRIAGKLPEDDLRRVIFQRLARVHGEHGWQNIFAAGYLGSHWLATYALRYEIAHPNSLHKNHESYW